MKILNMIKAQGVEYTFGIGDTDYQLYADKVEGVSTINLRYQGSVPFMAMAYSYLTGKPVVLEAYSGCILLVILVPAVDLRTEGMGEFRECDQRRIMGPITK